MNARGKHAASIGWMTRNFHYIKDLKPMAEYLKPPPTEEQKRVEGAAAVVAMLERRKQKEQTDGHG